MALASRRSGAFTRGHAERTGTRADNLDGLDGPDGLDRARERLTVARTTAARSARKVRFGVFVGLDREWEHLALSPALSGAVGRWWAAEPVLAGLSAGEIVARVRWDGYAATGEGAMLLSSLLRLASYPYASRCLLQALVPRIEAENVYTPTFGHGVGERWRHPADTAAELVAECFAAIARHAGERHQDVARLVVGEATRRLRTARQAERRHQQRTVALEARGAMSRSSGPLRGDLYSARSVAEWLASAVVGALKDGRLTEGQAVLLYATRVKGLPASEVGRLQRLAPKAVYHALYMAERALVGRAA